MYIFESERDPMFIGHQGSNAGRCGGCLTTTPLGALVARLKKVQSMQKTKKNN